MKIVTFKARFRIPEDTGYDELLPPPKVGPGADKPFLIYENFDPEGKSYGEERNGWTIMPPVFGAKGNIRTARVHKIRSCDLLPTADWTLWLDGVYELLIDPEELVKMYSRFDIVLCPHPTRRCIYDEAAAIIKRKKDEPSVVNKQVARYRREGFPRNAGLHATGAILRKRSELMRRFEREWWAEVQMGSRRDQMSFDYVLRKHRLTVGHFPGWKETSPFFRWRPHKQKHEPTSPQHPPQAALPAIVPSQPPTDAVRTEQVVSGAVGDGGQTPVLEVGA